MALKIVQGELFSIPPLPKTTRGHGIHIDATLKKRKRLLYCNGKHVIIRDLEDEFSSKAFGGHKCNVIVAKFSPNGEWVASGDERGNVIVWGSENFVIKNEIKAITSIIDISWGGDNSQIAAAGQGGEGVMGKVFRIDSSNSIGNLSSHFKKVLACALKPDRPFFLATASEDLSVNVYKGLPYKYVKKHENHKNYPNCVRYSPSGDKFISVGSDKKICIYSGEGEFLNAIDEKHEGNHKGSIYSCCFSPDGTRLLTSSSDKTVKIWDLESLECLTTFTFGKNLEDMQVSCFWLEGYLISVSLSGAINFLDESNPDTPKAIWNGHQTNVESAVILNDTDLYTSGGKGRIIKWDLENKISKRFQGKGHNDSPVVSIGASGGKIYSVGFDNFLCVGDLESLECAQKMKFDTQPVGVAVSKENPNLAFVITSGKKLYRIEGDQSVDEELEYKPTCISINSEGTLLAIGSDNKKVEIYKISENGQSKEFEIKKHTQEITFVAFSADGDHLLTTGKEGKSYVWEVNGNFEKPLNTRGWAFHDGKITGGCFLKGFEKVVTCSIDEKAIIFSETSKGNSAKRKIITPAHLGGVNLVLSLDDGRFITAGDDKCIRCWPFE